MHELITAIRTQSGTIASASLSRIVDLDLSTRTLPDSEVSDYIRDSDRAIPLSAQDEQELGWKIINDNCSTSREQMMRSNLRLVVAIARDYVGRGITIADLIAEGTVGLVRAVQTFDPARGARFSTCASWWIKAAMRRAIHSAAMPARASHA
ncbi:MAG: sigma-70 family RNA polymerase sigma factor [Planctomycetota bacterium]